MSGDTELQTSYSLVDHANLQSIQWLEDTMKHNQHLCTPLSIFCLEQRTRNPYFISPMKYESTESLKPGFFSFVIFVSGILQTLRASTR
jgi:hypothetical protein